MFCRNCGNKLDDDALFCESCGNRIREESVLSPEINEKKQEEKLEVANSQATCNEILEPVASKNKQQIRKRLAIASFMSATIAVSSVVILWIAYIVFDYVTVHYSRYYRYYVPTLIICIVHCFSLLFGIASLVLGVKANENHKFRITIVGVIFSVIAIGYHSILYFAFFAGLNI